MYVANLSFDGLYKQIYLARQQNWKKGSKHKLILLHFVKIPKLVDISLGF